MNKKDKSDLMKFVKGVKLGEPWAKSKRGGKRAGSGRKKTGNVAWLIRTKPETKKRMKEEAERYGSTPGEWLDMRFAKLQH